jgi:Cu/Ag efflux pump CusA
MKGLRPIRTGTSDPIVVRVFGSDLDTLRAKGQEVERLLAGIHGTIDTHLESEEDVPQIQVQVDLKAAQRYGITPGDVRRDASTAAGVLHPRPAFVSPLRDPGAPVGQRVAC